jgi:PTH1 family peptidyl-tRNA hydrolase
MYIIAGLGNPGRKYMYTRHNVGFEVIDLLAAGHGIRVNKARFKGAVGLGKIAGCEVMLLKPMTYMNLSGMSVLDAVEYYRVEHDNLMVIYDDVDLELGQVRIRKKGGGGTHNGMKSVIYQLQTEDFPRLRLGIGKPAEGEDISRYVLDRFSRDQRNIIDEAEARAAHAVLDFIRDGLETAMDRYNG